MPQEVFVDIVLEDIPATASLGGRKYYATLPSGYLWELQEAYFYIDTAKGASATNCNIWKLYRDSDDAVMASASGAGALTQHNTMVLGTDLTVNAAAAIARVYASYETSGAGETISEGARICARFKARRPGVAA